MLFEFFLHGWRGRLGSAFATVAAAYADKHADIADFACPTVFTTRPRRNIWMRGFSCGSCEFSMNFLCNATKFRKNAKFEWNPGAKSYCASLSDAMGFQPKPSTWFRRSYACLGGSPQHLQVRIKTKSGRVTNSQRREWDQDENASANVCSLRTFYMKSTKIWGSQITRLMRMY